MNLCFRGDGFGLYVVSALVGCFGWWFQGGCCAARFVFAWYFLLTLGCVACLVARLCCVISGFLTFWFAYFRV